MQCSMMAQTDDPFSNVTAEQAIETHKYIDDASFLTGRQTCDDSTTMEISCDTAPTKFGLTEPISTENTLEMEFQDALDDLEELDWVEISSTPPNFSIQDSHGEETMSYSMIVFGDFILQSNALLNDQVNSDTEHDNQYTWSIEESKSIEDLIRMKQTV